MDRSRRTIHRPLWLAVPGVAVLAVVLTTALNPGRLGASDAPATLLPTADGTRSTRLAVQPTTPPHQPRSTTQADGPAYGRQSGDLPAGGADIDSTWPGITGLDPDLRRAVHRAEEAMGEAGIRMWVTSGWRTVGYQKRLFDEAVQTRGSVAEAAKYVARPDASAHVTGDAVDIGPAAADYWLIRHGVDYGLCRTYANEKWHFELTAVDGVCPPMKAGANE